jgi:aspartate ammonia-lyase
LRAVTGLRDLELTGDFGDAAQNVDELLDVAMALEILARLAIKQAGDLRLLSSGPDAGLEELALPAVQPGSSAVPGKVNPVIPEFVIQCAMQAIGATTACGLAAEHGELDLNVWEGVLYYNLFVATTLMGSAMRVFVGKCLSGIDVVESRNREHAVVPTALSAKLAMDVSYSSAAAKVRAGKMRSQRRW